MNSMAPSQTLSTCWLLASALAWFGCQKTSEPSLVEAPLWSVDSLLTSNATPRVEEAVAQVEWLAHSDARASLHEVGVGDVGRPIHALVLDATPCASAMGGLESLKDRMNRIRQGGRKPVVLVNNAIHPGEPCGVNASLALAMEWLSLPDGDGHPLRDATWVIVPQYNVGGASRRNCCTRANQDGPEAYGFRGNAQNLDLNRDFIKMDSRNAFAFVELFHAVEPDVFVDTHTSNGADYPYVMTLITTQPDKAGPVLGPFLRDSLNPSLYADMKARGWPMVPYVHTRGETPDDGIMDFLESPRYSTGYTTLFGVLGFTTEAHMLKPFDQRVKATKSFLESMAAWLHGHGQSVLDVRDQERLRVASATTLPVRWRLDEAVQDSIWFEGYEARREWSNVTQSRRLAYDRESTWAKHIRYDSRYVSSDSADVPDFWVVPQAWRHVVERLVANDVEMAPLNRDTSMVLQTTYVESFSSSSRPYEGHHPLSIETYSVQLERVDLYRGDWLIPAQQPARRFLAEVFSPRAHDAYVVWNFFDAALQRKEYFSGYVFEDTAEEMLAQDDGLAQRYEEARLSHPEWTERPREALMWLYEQSDHDEGTAYRLPVFAGWNDLD